MELSSNRTPPHSIECEQALLASIILDGRVNALHQAIQSGVSAECFHIQKHQYIYSAMLSLNDAHTSTIDEVLLIGQLTRDGTLNEVGDTYLLEVTNRIDTPIGLPEYIDTVLHAYQLREIMRVSYETLNTVGDGNYAPFEILNQIREQCGEIEGVQKKEIGRSPFDFTIPEPGHHSILVGNRYINRGDGGIIAAPSGVGKSSLIIMISVYWACGRAFMGIMPNGPKRSLIVQAEDAEGDIAEAFYSVIAHGKFTDDELKLIRTNIRVVKNKVDRGERFTNKLYGYVKGFSPDLVWLNPLHAYIDGEISKASDAGRFLREQLNAVNRDDKFAYMIVHHTTKPVREKADANWNEIMYDMSGSAELINWARFIITLKPRKSEGKFVMHLAKRGRRAGVCKLTSEAQFHTQSVTQISIEYANDKFEYNGRTLPSIYWIQTEGGDDEADEDEDEKKMSKSPYSEAEVLNCFPGSYEKREKAAVIAKRANERMGMPANPTFYRWRKKLMDEGAIFMNDTDNKYYR